MVILIWLPYFVFLVIGTREPLRMWFIEKDRSGELKRYLAFHYGLAFGLFAKWRLSFWVGLPLFVPIVINVIVTIPATIYYRKHKMYDFVE